MSQPLHPQAQRLDSLGYRRIPKVDISFMESILLQATFSYIKVSKNQPKTSILD